MCRKFSMVIVLTVMITLFRIKGCHSDLLDEVSKLNLTLMDDMVVPNHFFKDVSYFYLSPGSVRLWPNGRIPYRISGKFTIHQVDSFKAAINWWNKNTCIRWVEKSGNDSAFVNVVNSDGCASSVGKQGGIQNMWLNGGCFNIQTLIHEMMHATGFIHEHSRPDRDEHVKIFFENIQKGKEHNFMIARGNLYSNIYKFAYDQNSVMHYTEFSFSNGHGMSIVAKNRGKLRCAHLDTCPTASDIMKINTIYKCK